MAENPEKILNNKIKPSDEERQTLRLSLPGKTFLLGEYAVLAGEPSVVAAVGPRFEIHAHRQVIDPSQGGVSFADESPVGRLLSEIKERDLPIPQFRFFDPHWESGGFGASTAQFALVFYLLQQFKQNQSKMSSQDLNPFWRRAWKTYRRLTSASPCPPSGADLVAQICGGVVEFNPKEEGDVRPFRVSSSPFPWERIWIFSATKQEGRKVATHEHLKTLVERGFLEKEKEDLLDLGVLVRKGVSAIREGEPETLADVANAYAEKLWSKDLEINLTHEDRNVLRRLPGVLAAKGTGALQADAIWVLTDGNPVSGVRLLREAQERGLECVCRGLKNEPGLRLDGEEENEEGGELHV